MCACREVSEAVEMRSHAEQPVHKSNEDNDAGSREGWNNSTAQSRRAIRQSPPITYVGIDAHKVGAVTFRCDECDLMLPVARKRAV